MVTTVRVLWSAACFAVSIVSLAAISQMAGPYRGYDSWTYANDVAMQLVVAGFGFGITAFAKRPIIWGAIISVCGIFACIAFAGSCATRCGGCVFF